VRNYLRHDKKNALCLCHNHHRYYTERHATWEKFLRDFYPEEKKYVDENKFKLGRGIDYGKLADKLSNEYLRYIRGKDVQTPY
jgi:hypothetical protein